LAQADVGGAEDGATEGDVGWPGGPVVLEPDGMVEEFVAPAIVVVVEVESGVVVGAVVVARATVVLGAVGAGRGGAVVVGAGP